jgi:hypothetical protein
MGHAWVGRGRSAHRARCPGAPAPGLPPASAGERPPAEVASVESHSAQMGRPAQRASSQARCRPSRRQTGKHCTRWAMVPWARAVKSFLLTADAATGQQQWSARESSALPCRIVYAYTPCPSQVGLERRSHGRARACSLPGLGLHYHMPLRRCPQQSTVRPAAADSRSLTSCGGLAAIARRMSGARFCREIASHDEIAGRLALVLAEAYNARGWSCGCPVRQGSTELEADPTAAILSNMIKCNLLGR